MGFLRAPTLPGAPARLSSQLSSRGRASTEAASPGVRPPRPASVELEEVTPDQEFDWRAPAESPQEPASERESKPGAPKEELPDEQDAPSTPTLEPDNPEEYGLSPTFPADTPSTPTLEPDIQEEYGLNPTSPADAPSMPTLEPDNPEEYDEERTPPSRPAAPSSPTSPAADGAPPSEHGPPAGLQLPWRPATPLSPTSPADAVEPPSEPAPPAPPAVLSPRPARGSPRTHAPGAEAAAPTAELARLPGPEAASAAAEDAHLSEWENWTEVPTRQELQAHVFGTTFGGRPLADMEERPPNPLTLVDPQYDVVCRFMASLSFLQVIDDSYKAGCGVVHRISDLDGPRADAETRQACFQTLLSYLSGTPEEPRKKRSQRCRLSTAYQVPPIDAQAFKFAVVRPMPGTPADLEEPAIRGLVAVQTSQPAGKRLLVGLRRPKTLEYLSYRRLPEATQYVSAADATAPLSPQQVSAQVQDKELLIIVYARPAAPAPRQAATDASPAGPQGAPDAHQLVLFQDTPYTTLMRRYEARQSLQPKVSGQTKDRLEKASDTDWYQIVEKTKSFKRWASAAHEAPASETAKTCVARAQAVIASFLGLQTSDADVIYKAIVDFFEEPVADAQALADSKTRRWIRLTRQPVHNLAAAYDARRADEELRMLQGCALEGTSGYRPLFELAHAFLAIVSIKHKKVETRKEFVAAQRARNMAKDAREDSRQETARAGSDETALERACAPDGADLSCMFAPYVCEHVVTSTDAAGGVFRHVKYTKPAGGDGLPALLESMARRHEIWLQTLVDQIVDISERCLDLWSRPIVGKWRRVWDSTRYLWLARVLWQSQGRRLAEAVPRASEAVEAYLASLRHESFPARMLQFGPPGAPDQADTASAWKKAWTALEAVESGLSKCAQVEYSLAWTAFIRQNLRNLRCPTYADMTKLHADLALAAKQANLVSPTHREAAYSDFRAALDVLEEKYTVVMTGLIRLRGWSSDASLDGDRQNLYYPEATVLATIYDRLKERVIDDKRKFRASDFLSPGLRFVLTAGAADRRASSEVLRNEQSAAVLRDVVDAITYYKYQHQVLDRAVVERMSQLSERARQHIIGVLHLPTFEEAVKSNRGDPDECRLKMCSLQGLPDTTLKKLDRRYLTSDTTVPVCNAKEAKKFFLAMHPDKRGARVKAILAKMDESTAKVVKGEPHRDLDRLIHDFKINMDASLEVAQHCHAQQLYCEDPQKCPELAIIPEGAPKLGREWLAASEAFREACIAKLPPGSHASVREHWSRLLRSPEGPPGDLDKTAAAAWDALQDIWRAARLGLADGAVREAWRQLTAVSERARAYARALLARSPSVLKCFDTLEEDQGRGRAHKASLQEIQTSKRQVGEHYADLRNDMEFFTAFTKEQPLPPLPRGRVPVRETERRFLQEKDAFLQQLDAERRARNPRARDRYSRNLETWQAASLLAERRAARRLLLDAQGREAAAALRRRRLEELQHEVLP